MRRPMNPASRWQFRAVRRLAFCLFLGLAAGWVERGWPDVASVRGEDVPAGSSHGFATAIAIKDAKVVAATGKVFEPGTVVVRGGVIEAVGPAKDRRIPFDAEVIEGKGLVIYPGFIDLFTTVAQRAGVDRSTTGRGRPVDLSETSLAVTPADNRKGLSPEFEAAGSLELTDALVEPRRAWGSPTCCLPPAGPSPPARRAWSARRTAAARGVVVKAPVALHIHLGPPPTDAPSALTGRPDAALPQQGHRGGEWGRNRCEAENPYPRVLMGSIAHFRQAMLDAEHHHARSDQGSHEGEHP